MSKPKWEDAPEWANALITLIYWSESTNVYTHPLHTDGVTLIARSEVEPRPKWKPKWGERYYTIVLGEIYIVRSPIWSDTDKDEVLYSQNIVFKTKEECIAKAKEMGLIK